VIPLEVRAIRGGRIQDLEARVAELESLVGNLGRGQ